MRRFFLLLLALVLLLSGCGKPAPQEEANAESNYKPPEVVGNTTQTAEKEDYVQPETGYSQAEPTVDNAGKFPVITGQNRFSVFSINMNGAGSDKSEDRSEKLAALMQLLVQKNPDIITFQEVGSGWMDYILPQLKGIYDYYLIYPNDQDKSDANPIFYKIKKFEDQNGGCFWLSETPEECSPAANGKYYNCTWLQLQEKGTENAVYIFNSRLEPAIGAAGAETIRAKCEAVGWRNSIVCSVDLGAPLDSEAGTTLLKNFKNGNTAGDTTATSGNGVQDFSLYTKVALTPASYAVVPAAEATDHHALFTEYTVNTEVLNYEGEFVF